MTSTTKYKIPYPEQSDFANIPGDMKKLAEKIEEIIKKNSIPIGTGRDYFGTEAPEDYMFADGSAISRTDYAELFALIGTTYGAGDGSTTFNLPDKREAVSIMKGDTYSTLGASVGANTKAIAKSNLPNYTLYNDTHNHTQNPHHHLFSTGGNAISVYANSGVLNGNGFETSSPNTAWANTNINLTSIAQSTATNQSATITVKSGGSDTPFNVMQKTLVCNYIIKVK